MDDEDLMDDKKHMEEIRRLFPDFRDVSDIDPLELERAREEALDEEPMSDEELAEYKELDKQFMALLLRCCETTERAVAEKRAQVEKIRSLLPGNKSIHTLLEMSERCLKEAVDEMLRARYLRAAFESEDK